MMTIQPPASYPDWKAPSEDAGSLIWPEPAQLLQETRENRQRLSAADRVRIQNIPLPRLRFRARQSIGHDDAQPLIATGHQAELHHAGVWAKNPLMDTVAERLGGQAYHLAVDTDAPKHLSLRWPSHALPLTDDPAVSSAAWSGLLASPTASWLDHLEQTARADRALAYGPMLFDFLASLRRLSRDATALDPLLTDAMHDLDETLGLRHRALIASTLWQSEPFLAFAHHILARALAFTHDYNGALAHYRRLTGTRSPTRPMPDLFIGGEAIEVPFWLDDLANHSRRRPSVFAVGQSFRLPLLNGEEFIFDPHADGEQAAADLSLFLQRHQYRLSPRALTLTLFVRLVVADQFVHGIGGARYDQVTDRIIASHFGIEPPKFSVTTATLYFPGAAGRERVCMPCVLREGHHLQHAVLGARKRELVAHIAELPRGSAARSAAFAAMQSARRAAAAVDPAVINWQKRLHEAETQQKAEQTLFDRELFYAVQPRERLMELVERYQAAFASL